MFLWLIVTCTALLGTWPTVLLLAWLLPELRSVLCILAMALTVLAGAVVQTVGLGGFLLMTAADGDESAKFLFLAWIGASFLVSFMLWVFYRMYKHAEMLVLCEETGIKVEECKAKFKSEKIAAKQAEKEQRVAQRALNNSQPNPWIDPPK